MRRRVLVNESSYAYATSQGACKDRVLSQPSIIPCPCRAKMSHSTGYAFDVNAVTPVLSFQHPCLSSERDFLPGFSFWPVWSIGDRRNVSHGLWVVQICRRRRACGTGARWVSYRRNGYCIDSYGIF